jgi:hypothetical protein
MMTDEALEQHLRREARQQGLVLRKSRCRTPEAMEYGTYMPVDLHTNVIVAGGQWRGFGLSLADVRDCLGEL